MDVRKVSSKSQLTLPKEFAGRLVSMEMLAEGVIQIKVGEFVPDAGRLAARKRVLRNFRSFNSFFLTFSTILLAELYFLRL